MKISLFQSILMGVFGLGAVIGLFVFATYKGTPKNAAGPVLIWGTLPKAHIEATFTALSPVNTELKNVTYVEKNAKTLGNDLATAIATDASPDLILASQEELKSLAKLIIPIPLSTLSASTYQSTFVDEANIFTAPGGEGYYGVPFLLDPLVLFSNRTILSSNAITRPPGTWEALTGLVPNIAILTSSRQITRGLIALGTYSNVRSARGILSTLFLQTGVPVSTFSTTGMAVGNLGARADSGVPPGKSVLSFYTQFADPSKVSYTWNASLPDSEQMFLTGDLTLYLGYASRARSLRTANPNLDFAVTAVPQPATASTKSVYGVIYAFMTSRGAKNPTGAFQIASLLSQSAQQTAAAVSTGLAPVTFSAISITPPDPVATVAYGEALYARGWLSPSADVTDQVFSGMIEDVISIRSSIDTALAAAEQLLTAYLQQ